MCKEPHLWSVGRYYFHDGTKELVKEIREMKHESLREKGEG
jgi:hypothetical protein